MVCEVQARPPLEKDPGPLQDRGFGDHAPADPGHYGHPILQAVSFELSYGKGLGPGLPSEGAQVLGRNGLLSPGTKPPSGGPGRYRKMAREDPVGPQAARDPSRHRAFHRRGYREHRFREAGTDTGWKRETGSVSAIRNPGRPQASSCSGAALEVIRGTSTHPTRRPI